MIRRLGATVGRRSMLSRRFSSSLLQVADEVQEALSQHQPVVALESTIVSHGLPYPQNLELCRSVSKILRDANVVPATVAIRNGVARVGLEWSELEDLAVAGQEGRAQKVSTRDLPIIMARQYSSEATYWGSTTVASTMLLAHQAGISTFVTGGMGGVHRDEPGEISSMDVSADLIALATTPMVLVSAGIKSILDIRRTLEVLETQSVPVVAYQTDDFPAFFSAASGVLAPARMDTAEEIAEAYLTARRLNMSQGMMVAVPIPHPAGAEVEEAIQSALQQARDDFTTGPAVTPYVLKQVAEKTGGASVASNVELVQNNALVGAQIAKAIAAAQRREQDTSSTVRRNGSTTPSLSDKPHNSSKSHTQLQPSRVVVVGGMVLDAVAQPTQELVLGSSTPAVVRESDGGVGRNVAEVLGRLGSNPILYSALGQDSAGLALRQGLNDCGVQTSDDTLVTVEDGVHTATYMALMDESGDLHAACADTAVLQHIPIPPLSVLEEADVLMLDANPTIDVLRQCAQAACRAGTKVFFEPTSVPKATLVARHDYFLACLTYASPNLDELFAMAGTTTDLPSQDSPLLMDESRQRVQETAALLLRRMHPDEAHLLITCGEQGVLLASKDRLGNVTFDHFTAHKAVSVHNATGAGDTLSGAFVHALLNGKKVHEAVSVGMEAATLTLQCPDKTISPLLSTFEL